MSSHNESEPFLSDNEALKVPVSRHSFAFGRTWALMQTKIPTLPTIGSHSLVFIFTSIFWAAYLLFLPVLDPGSYLLGQLEGNSSVIRGANFVNCGRSVAEAEARGCEYDILSNHWIPGQCADESAVKEYQSDGSWFGYADANHTQLLDIAALGRTPVYYTNERDHIIHCSFLWRKQYKAFMEGRKFLDSVVVDEEHTMHCSDFLVKMSERGPDFRTMPIKVHVGFAGCHIRVGSE